MKTLASLLILFFAIQNASAQLYVTAGVSRSKQGGDYYDRKIYQDVFSSANKDRFMFDFYEFGVIYKNEGLVIGGNLGLTYNNLNMRQVQSSLSYSGASQFGTSTTHYKNYNVKFAYLGPKLTVSKAFFHKKNFNLNLGGFINVEFLLGEKESNHSDSIVNRWYGSYYDQTTMQQVNYSGSSYEISYAEFDEFRAIGALLSLGLTLSSSYTINRFRIAASFSYGLNFNSRTAFRNYSWSSFTEEEERNIFYPQVGLSVGYQLERKSD